MERNAKKQAIHDMEEDLHREGRKFISFISALDPIMETLVNNQISRQASINP